jgi:hypothetical protein
MLTIAYLASCADVHGSSAICCLKQRDRVSKCVIRKALGTGHLYLCIVYIVYKRTNENFSYSVCAVNTSTFYNKRL